MREDKQKYAMTTDGKPNLVIDDDMKNVNEWKAKGGVGGLVWPSAEDMERCGRERGVIGGQ